MDFDSGVISIDEAGVSTPVPLTDSVDTITRIVVRDVDLGPIGEVFFIRYLPADADYSRAFMITSAKKDSKQHSKLVAILAINDRIGIKPGKVFTDITLGKDLATRDRRVCFWLPDRGEVKLKSLKDYSGTVAIDVRSFSTKSTNVWDDL